MSKQSNLSTVVIVIVCLAGGFGLSYVARPALEAGGGAGDAGDAGDADVKGLREEVAKLRAAGQATDEHLVELSANFAEHFLVSRNYYLVTKVVDGDTFELGKWKVRLLGVNTPESVKPGTPVQWYGIASSNHMKKLILGKKVRLVAEKGEQLGTGVYNRVLAYVYLEDGTDVNAKVVEGGYGQSYHKYPCGRMKEFDAYQAKARAAKRGQWNDEARLIWEDANIIPDVPAAEAKVIVSKSGIVHAVECGAGPSVKNGTFFRSPEQAAKFKFTRLHSCLVNKKGDGK